MRKFPTEKSLSSSTKSCDVHFSSTVGSVVKNKNNYKPFQEAIDRYKKLCVKTFINAQQNFITTLKGENLNLFLDNYRLKDIQVINKIVGSYFYFRQIYLSPYDARACSCGVNLYNNLTVKSKVNSCTEKYIEEKERRDKENEKLSKIYTIIQGIAKNLCLSEELESFNISHIDLKTELCEFLAEGIGSNKSLANLSINHSQFTNESFEIFGKGLLSHPSLENLDLSSNSLDDKCGNMISRIIIRQTQRRDQTIWMHGLRNERPLNNDYTRGLISLNLSNNKLADCTADDISYGISYDSYIRSIDLRNNNFSLDACKKFIKVLRKNLTVLNLDLRGNYGYNTENNLHKRLVIKLAKNIKHLHNQFLDGLFDKIEYEYLKKYVNYEFFNVEVPPHIIEIFNSSNLNSNVEMKENSLGDKSKEENNGLKYEENKEKILELKSKNLNGNREKENNKKFEKNVSKNDDKRKNKIQAEDTYLKKPCISKNKPQNSNNDDLNNSNDQEEKELQNETDNINQNDEVDDMKYEGFNTDGEVDISKLRANKKYLLQIEKLKLQNRNLFHENLHLRKQILSMRAQVLHNTINKGFSVSNSAQNNQQILNNNSNNAFYAEDINNPITQNLSLTGTNNNINLSNNQRLPPVTGEEGSYENYYNRIENLFSELSRLMDNMENNIRRNDN